MPYKDKEERKEHARNYMRLRYRSDIKFRERMKQQSKNYRKNNPEKVKEQRKIQFKKHYLKYREKRKESSKKYNQIHKEKKKEYDKKHRKEHLLEIKEKKQKYYLKNNELIKAKSKRWRKEHPEEFKKLLRDYYKTHKETYFIQAIKRKRCFGFNPINERFDNSEAHHIDKINVVYIPKDVHKSFKHIQENEESMKQINIIAWGLLEAGIL